MQPLWHALRVEARVYQRAGRRPGWQARQRPSIGARTEKPDVSAEKHGREWLKFEHMVAGAGRVMEATWRTMPTEWMSFLCTPLAWRAMRKHAWEAAGLQLLSAAELVRPLPFMIAVHSVTASHEGPVLLPWMQCPRIASRSRFLALCVLCCVRCHRVASRAREQLGSAPMHDRCRTRLLPQRAHAQH